MWLKVFPPARVPGSLAGTCSCNLVFEIVDGHANSALRCFPCARLLALHARPRKQRSCAVNECRPLFSHLSANKRDNSDIYMAAVGCALSESRRCCMQIMLKS